MACVNPNSPEFKKILETEPNPLLAEIIYNEKYGDLLNENFNNEEMVLKETELSKSKLDFSAESDNWNYKKTDAVEIDNYVLLELIKKNGKPTDSLQLEKFNQVANAIGEQEAFRDYFENNKIVRPSSVIQEKINARIEESFETMADMMVDFGKQPSLETPEDYLKFVKDNFNTIVEQDNQTVALNLAEALSKKLNIPYEIISDEDMAALFPNEPFRKNFYRGGKVYLAKGSLSASSVFHEFAHPVIKSLSQDNPKLFNSLFEELVKTEIGQTIITNLNQDSYYTPGTAEYMEEAIVQALEAINGDTNITEEPKVKNWIQKIFFAIKQFLRGQFGKKINISKLNDKTTLSQFVEMINYGKEFVLNQEFLEKDLFTMFETDYTKMQEELQKNASEQTQVVMNQFYQITANQLSRFQLENDIFKKIEKDLADTNREGLLQKVEGLMQNIVTIGNRQLVTPLDKLKVEGDTKLEKDALEFVQRIKAFSDSIFMTQQVADKYISKLQELEKIENFDTDEFDQVFAIMQFVEVWKQQIETWEKGSLLNSSEWTSALNDLSQKLNQAQRIANRLSSDKVIDVLYDTLTEQMEPIKEDFLDQMQTAKDSNNLKMYNKLHLEYYGITVEEKFRLLELESISKSTISRQEAEELLQLRLRSYDGHDISKDQLKAYAAGLLPDAGVLNGLMESYLSSQDLIVGGFATYLQKTFNTIDGNANARRSELYNGLDGKMKAAGYGDIKSRFASEGAMGKDLSTINKSFELNEDGKVIEYLEYRFKSNFKDYEFDLNTLTQAVLEAKKDFNFRQTEETKKAYTDAQKELEEFLTDYMNRDYDPRYYEVQQKYLYDELGTEAREAQNDIFRRMRQVEDNITLAGNLKQKSAQLDLLWSEYSNLSNIYDENGKSKTGKSLAIAERLIEYRNEIQEFYEWEEKEGLFNDTFDLYKLGLKNDGLEEGTEAYDEKVKEWLLLNTQVSVKQSYYDVRTQLIEKRTEILAELQAVNDENLDVGPLYEKVFAIIKSTRDDFNQYDGNKINAKAQKEIQKIMQEIADMKDKWLLASGVTKQDLSRYRNIDNFYMNNQGKYLSKEDRIFHQRFWEIAEATLLRFGITKTDVLTLRKVNQYLSKMTSSGLTQTYIETFTKFVTSNPESTKIFADSQRATDILDGDMPIANELFDTTKNIELIERLKEANPEFAEWFDRNHYTEEIDEYDTTGRYAYTQTIYRSTPVWSYSNPSDVNEYEAKVAVGMPKQFSSRGFIEIDGVPRVPTRAYQRRLVKEQYQTEKILEDYVDESGNLILANRDNRGKWLPKDYNPSQPYSAKTNKYIDASYKAMFKEDRPKWDLLDHVKKAHLNNQKLLDNSQKLFLSYPRYRKGALEVYDRNWWNRKKLRLRDTWYQAVDDYEIGFYTGSTADKSIYNSFSRPISGSFKLPLLDVSTNIIESVMDHAYSVEQFKAMRDVNSVSNLLKNTLEVMSTTEEGNVLAELEVQKIAKNQSLLTERKSKASNRAKQVQSLISKHLKGQSIKTFSDQQDEGLGKVELRISKLIGIAAQKMAFMSFAADPVKSLTNYFGGKLMTWKKSTEGRWYNTKDLAVTRAKSLMVIKEMIAKQYSNEVPSAILQLLDVTGAVPSGLKKEIGGRAGRTVATSVAEGAFFYADRRYLNDSTVVHQFLAMLEHARFELNGKTVSLADAVELRDGKIYTKEGVPAELSITYDEKGRIQLGSKLTDITNAHQSFLQKNIGVASEYTEPEAYRTVLGKFVLFLVKFFPGMALDKYQIRTKKGKFGNRRLNLQSKQAEIGTYLSLFTGINELWNGTYNPKKMSWQTRKGFLGILSTVLVQYLLRQLQMMIYFRDSDDEDFSIAWNPDEDSFYNMNGVLKKSTSALGEDNPFVSKQYTVNNGAAFSWENYFKLQALRIILRVENEERTFNPEQALFTGGSIATLQSPLADGGAVKEIFALIDEVRNITTNDKDGIIKKAPGPYVWQEEDRYKIWNIFGRLVGVKGDLLYPQDVIKREKRYFREGVVDWGIKQIPDLPNVIRLKKSTTEEIKDTYGITEEQAKAFFEKY